MILIVSADSGIYAYNNTVFNCGTRGYYTTTDDVIAKNNIAQDCTDGYYGTFDSSSDYNISDVDGDAPNVNFGGGFATVTFADKDGDPPDFHLADNDIAAKNQGTDLQSEGDFTDDIDGQTRVYRGPWDIGADEIPPASTQVIFIGF